jgi:hypothetical protein
VILGQMPLTSARATMFTIWFNAGGNVTAMRTDMQLAILLGIADTGTSLSNEYLLVNTSGTLGAQRDAGTLSQFKSVSPHLSHCFDLSTFFLFHVTETSARSADAATTAASTCHPRRVVS